MSSRRFFHDHGSCQTFRPDKTSEGPMPGERRGYHFQFLYVPGEDNFTEGECGPHGCGMLPGGLDVFIHDAGEWWTGCLVQCNSFEAYYKL